MVFRCHCGNLFCVPESMYDDATIISCGCQPNRKTRQNNKYMGVTVGESTVIARELNDSYLMRCKCGNKFTVWSATLRHAIKHNKPLMCKDCIDK